MVRTAYLDTSAAMKLLVEESESEALLRELTGSRRRLAASWLLHTELHCAAGRNPAVIAVAAITTVLDAIDLVDLTRGDLLAAGTHAPLWSNDAIHLATALRLGVDERCQLRHRAKSSGGRGRRARDRAGLTCRHLFHTDASYASPSAKPVIASSIVRNTRSLPPSHAGSVIGLARSGGVQPPQVAERVEHAA